MPDVRRDGGLCIGGLAGEKVGVRDLSRNQSTDDVTKGDEMAQDFRQGERVKWNTPQGETYGKVKKRLTSDTEVGGTKVNASEEDPRYLVESEKSGKEAAHKPDSLSKA